MSRLLLLSAAVALCLLAVTVNVKAAECPKGICRMKCPNGFQKDSNGCEICKCKFRCPLAGCLIFCEHGKKTDANGCEKCECNAAPKRAICKECRMACPPGQDFPRDNDGCPTSCECA